TNALKECLREFDGFLIIADTPRDGARQDWHSDELRRLREAFSSLSDDEQFALRTPVAVMLTKWDRYSEIDFENPSYERRKLDGFLEEHPAHRSLVDSIQNAIATASRRAEPQARVPDSPVADGQLTFPSSAFGKANLKDGKELPSGNETPVFGLLEPFL